MSERINQVRQRCAEVFAEAHKLYGFSTNNVQIRFDLRGRTAGMAGYKTVFGQRKYFLRFNVDMIANNGFDHIFKDTVPHEIAHLVCFENPKLGNNHDAGWRRVCRQLGGNGERCHKEEVSYAKGKTYQYVTSNGKTVSLSEIRHRKIQQGVVYRFKYGWGHIDRNSKWSILGQSAQIVENTKPKNEIENNNMSKADHVRMIIKLAKNKGIDQDAVITAVTVKVGMPRTQAQRYVKENWNKV